MAAQGGPIVRLNIGGRNFSVAQDSDPARDIGGKQGSIEMNGDNTARVISEIVPSKIGPAAIVIDDENGDHEYIQSKKEDGLLVDCEVEYASGAIWYGQMAVVDATEFSPKSSTMEVTLSGEPLTQQ